MGSGQSKDRVHIVRGGPDAPLPPEFHGGAASSAAPSSASAVDFQKPSYPTPTGREHEVIDRIASKLPQFMDEVTRQRVVQAAEQCQDGKGPMIPCFNHAEFLTQFQSRHTEAEEFFVNTCFRPKEDKSPHGVLVDDSKSFPAACFQLGNMRMTGKGGTPFNRAEAYRLYDRACRGGHGGGCHLQARMLLSYPGQLGPDIPYNPQKAAELLEMVCRRHNDPMSCFTVASLYLRGDKVSSEAMHATPQEAQGRQKIQTASSAAYKSTAVPGTPDASSIGTISSFEEQSMGSQQPRAKHSSDERKAIKRSPKKALELLMHACNNLQHGGACHNLAVMYSQGDDGVPVDQEKAQYYKAKTEELTEAGAGMFPF